MSALPKLSTPYASAHPVAAFNAAHLSLEAFESSFYQSEEPWSNEEASTWNEVKPWVEPKQWTDKPLGWNDMGWSSAAVQRKSDFVSSNKTNETMAGPSNLGDPVNIYEENSRMVPWLFQHDDPSTRQSNPPEIVSDPAIYNGNFVNSPSPSFTTPMRDAPTGLFSSVRKTGSKKGKRSSSRRHSSNLNNNWDTKSSNSLSKFTLPDKNGKRKIRNDIMSIAESLPALPGLYFDKKQKGFRVRYQNVYVGWVALSRFPSIEEAYCSARDIWENAKAHAEKFQTPQAAIIASLPLQKQAKASGKNRGGRPRTVTQLPAEWGPTPTVEQRPWVGSDASGDTSQQWYESGDISTAYTNSNKYGIYPIDAENSDLIQQNLLIDDHSMDQAYMNYSNYANGQYHTMFGYNPSPISYGKPVNDENYDFGPTVYDPWNSKCDDENTSPN